MKILIISEYIAPMQEIASKRWSKIAKYMKKNYEVEISVLTTEKNYDDEQSDIEISKKDPLLIDDQRYFEQYFFIEYDFWWKQFFRMRKTKELPKVYSVQDAKSQKNGIIKTMYLYFKQIIFDCLQKRMGHLAYKRIKKEVHDFDVIISSYGPLWVHHVSQKIKKKYPHIKWIADFRDQCAREGDVPMILEYHKKFVRKNCAEADMLIKISDVMEIYQDDKQKVVTITNGYDHDEIVEPQKPEKFNVVYTGQLYPGRSNISVVARAIRELVQEEKIEQEDVVFQYAGMKGELFKHQIEMYDRESVVEILGIVPREQAIALQSNAAILLQAGWNTSKEKCEWTGKMYEYMVAQKPIVYCVTGEVPFSRPYKYIERLGGICHEECRDEECYPLLKEYILNKYLGWKNTGDVSVNKDDEYIDSFSYKEIAKKVWNVINNI